MEKGRRERKRAGVYGEAERRGQLLVREPKLFFAVQRPLRTKGKSVKMPQRERGKALSHSGTWGEDRRRDKNNNERRRKKDPQRKHFCNLLYSRSKRGGAGVGKKTRKKRRKNQKKKGGEGWGKKGKKEKRDNRTSPTMGHNSTKWRRLRGGRRRKGPCRVKRQKGEGYQNLKNSGI